MGDYINHGKYRTCTTCGLNVDHGEPCNHKKDVYIGVDLSSKSDQTYVYTPEIEEIVQRGMEMLKERIIADEVRISTLF